MNYYGPRETHDDAEDPDAVPSHPAGIIDLTTVELEDGTIVVWHPDRHMDEWIETDVAVDLVWMR